MRKALATWSPSAVVVALIAGALIALPLQAKAVTLPEKSAEDIIGLMALDPVAFSGTVVKTTNLGLPELEMSSLLSDEMVAQMEETMPDGLEDFIPQVIDDNLITDAISFAAGTDRVRVFASEQGMRAQILDPLSQRDIIVNAAEAWSYNAQTQVATQVVFERPLDKDNFDDAASSLEVDLSNPNALAERVLDQAGPNTVVSVGEPRLVAGRASYTLIVEPGEATSLVDYVTLSIDAQTGLGLGVQVFSSEQAEAGLIVEFESLTLETPDASLFSFTPPPGATIERPELPSDLDTSLRELADDSLSEDEREALARELARDFGMDVEPRLLGEGWTSVVALDALPEIFPRELLESELFGDFSVEVQGGTVFATPLATVLITDSGEVFAGAVTTQALLDIAAG